QSVPSLINYQGRLFNPDGSPGPFSGAERFVFAESGGEWGENGDDLPVVLAEELEMPIAGANQRIGMEFGQPHNAGIGKVHRRVRILSQQFRDRDQLVGQAN